MTKSVRRAGPLVILAAMLLAPSLAASTPTNRLMYLTFNAPVALPGITLAPGTYAFEVEPGNIVCVRNQDRTKVLYRGMVTRVGRPLDLGADRFLTFSAGRGSAKPIETWFPRDDAGGYRFVYAR